MERKVDREFDNKKKATNTEKLWALGQPSCSGHNQHISIYCILKSSLVRNGSEDKLYFHLRVTVQSVPFTLSTKSTSWWRSAYATAISTTGLFLPHSHIRSSYAYHVYIYRYIQPTLDNSLQFLLSASGFNVQVRWLCGQLITIQNAPSRPIQFRHFQHKHPLSRFTSSPLSRNVSFYCLCIQRPQWIDEKIEPSSYNRDKLHHCLIKHNSFKAS
jgi:hypothetical protein